MTAPLSRIRRELGGVDPVALLAGLAPTDLQSVLLEVYRRQAARLQPAEVLSRYRGSRFCRPALIEPERVAAFEASAWAGLPEGYTAVELSPLCPLGTCSAMATVDQNKAVSTVRNVEVVADTTNVLTLEAADRRRSLLADPEHRFTPVGLAACQRQVRAQGLPQPRSWAHFRLLGVVEAGRDEGSFGFETSALCRQIAYLVSLIRGLRPTWSVEVAVTGLSGRPDGVEHRVLERLERLLPCVTVRLDRERQSGRGYYLALCYKLFATDDAGDVIELGDGGCTDWTRQLLSDKKERLVIGGLGVERLLI